MQQAKIQPNNSQDFYNEILQVCVKYQRFNQAIDLLNQSLKEGVQLEYSRDYIMQIISQLKASPRIFEVGFEMMKTDIGFGMVQEIFPRSVADILQAGSSKTFEISFSETNDMPNLTGFKLSSHRYQDSDKRNEASTNVMIHKPGSNGRNWKLIPQAGGKYFKIIFSSENKSHEFSVAIDGHELAAHRSAQRDKRDAYSTQVIVHKPGWNRNLWQIVPCGDGNTFQLVFGPDDLSRHDNVDQEGWYLCCQDYYKEFDGRNVNSRYVHIHKSGAKGGIWYIKLNEKN